VRLVNLFGDNPAIASAGMPLAAPLIKSAKS
jgi:hypothetical protein